MSFPFYKNIDSYIVNELRSRTSDNNIKLSKMVPWIKATSNLGDRYTLGTETYSSLFDNSSSDAYGNSAGSQWKYRPNPIITDFSVDFASRGTLRRCTLKIKCFSPDQLTKVQQYFMEPGISCYIQWGWNYSMSSGKAIGPTPIDAGTIKKYYRNAQELNNVRAANNGCYDNFVGIIGGGDSVISGNEFDVTIKMVSLGEILMNKTNETVTDNTKITPLSYPPSKFTSYEQSFSTSLNFAYFYNQLPDSLRTQDLLDKESTFKADSDFINYNEALIEEAKWETTQGTFSGTLQIQASPSKILVAQDAESPINANKYVSFEAFIKLLNLNRVRFAKSNLTDFNLDISDSYCGAFTGMFSTDESVFIPNKETRGFLNDISILGGGFNQVLDTSVNGRSFVRTQASTLTSEGTSFTLVANTHGWIGDLYIENKIAMAALEDQSAPIKEILDSVLKTIEKAVEGLWSFQIIETDNGSAKRISIRDANLRNQRSGNAGSSIERFDMFGTDSFFLDANFNLNIAKEMASKVYMEKSTDAKSPDELTGLFSSKKDSVLGTLTKEDVKTGGTPETADLGLQRWVEFRRNVRIMINPKYVNKASLQDSNLAEWSIYSHFLNKRVFNDQRKGTIYSGGGEVYNGRTLPVGFDFTVLGMSGFQVGHLFNVAGLPEQYNNSNGAFQIEEVTHKIDSKQWITEVKSHYRPFKK